jgi:hypothetical protein
LYDAIAKDLIANPSTWVRIDPSAIVASSPLLSQKRVLLTAALATRVVGFEIQSDREAFYVFCTGGPGSTPEDL